MKKLILPLIAIIAIGLFLKQTFIGQLLLQGKVDDIADYVKTFGSASIIITTVFIMIQTFFPYIPFIALAGVSVLLFGLWGGFLVSWLATCSGATLTFLTSRYLAREWAERKVLHLAWFKRFNDLASTDGFLTIFLARISSVIPSSVINLTAGISQISRRNFILATFLGNLPITFAECWIGHFFIHLRQHHTKLLFILITFLLGIVLITGRLKRGFKT
ncbi:hypothetical protein BEP19_06885 [Ammoniphilus oxalaticus]|uniref:TVP38/TMEM64 family membrane protein n=1 Tax=Ammoniphilus oxalaticus TaxID=66863 RepID=A0A419SJH1_9BACL|nr:TVP38/TMEM64 family protein [Ammoniphilus oxalaticus]RKD24127.1 hypothetical protein BEP19_06885 [Ammoniphilus oxalaticus]